MTRHKTRQAMILCQQCAAWVVAHSCIEDPPKHGCALREAEDDIGMCLRTRARLLEMALRRAVLPDAFEGARIKPERLFDVLDAEAAAIRQVAALFGPVPARCGERAKE